MPNEDGLFTTAEVDKRIEAALKDRDSRDKNKLAAKEFEDRAKAAEEKLAQMESEKSRLDFNNFIKEKNIKLDEKKVEELFQQTKGNTELLNSMMTILSSGHEQTKEFDIHAKEAKVEKDKQKEKPEVDKEDEQVKIMLAGR